jgi:hypothetical protein
MVIGSCYKRHASRHSSVAPPQTYGGATAENALTSGNTAMVRLSRHVLRRVSPATYVYDAIDGNYRDVAGTSAKCSRTVVPS